MIRVLGILGRGGSTNDIDEQKSEIESAPKPPDLLIERETLGKYQYCCHDYQPKNYRDILSPLC